MEHLTGFPLCFPWTGSVTLGSVLTTELGAHYPATPLESIDSRDRNCLVWLPSGKMNTLGGYQGISRTPRKKNQVLGTVGTKP